METAEEPQKNTEERRRAAKNAFGKERGEGEIELDKGRLAQALKEEKKRKARDDDDRPGKRTRGDESYEVTEEQLGKEQAYCAVVRVLKLVVEAYRMTRNRMEDPMANYVDPEV